jgi:hypothetical protein
MLSRQSSVVAKAKYFRAALETFEVCLVGSRVPGLQEFYELFAGGSGLQ